ncbi:AraC family transcriptional regulator [Flexibacterium corallicola]|uniref:AraC family transcriptional regulator n=1 Tax=Flexibacterium corallicola TaxID=3037259 RepID=UPI00286F18BC|nr:AraC family transcriptional regulator [Pseudovibrio sp. M1P-2-3]
MSILIDHEVVPRDRKLTHSTFNTSVVAKSEQYDIWQTSISCIFETATPQAFKEDGFNACISSTWFNCMLFARTRCPGQTWVRTKLKAATDGLDHLMFQFYVTGEHTWQKKGDYLVLPRRGILVFDLSQEVTSITTHAETIVLIIPKLLLSQYIDISHNYHMKIFYPDSSLTLALYDHVLTLDRLRTDLSVSEAQLLLPATLSLVSACINSTLNWDNPAQLTALKSTFKHRLTDLIDRNLSNHNLSTLLVSGQMGMSRATLYRFLEDCGGVESFIRKRRLDHAAKLLSDPRNIRQKIYDIANEVGYKTEAGFCKAFKRQFGITPSDARNSYADIEQKNINIEGALDRSYEEWIRSM